MGGEPSAELRASVRCGPFGQACAPAKRAGVCSAPHSTNATFHRAHRAGACCKSEVVEFNPDGQPKEPQTKEQRQRDGVDLRNAAKAADWAQMKVLLRRMPVADINAGATNSEVQPEDKGEGKRGTCQELS